MALTPTVQRHERNLEKCLPKLAPVLQGTGLSPQKLKQTIVNSLVQNSYLASCTPESIMQSAMTAAVLGLECDNVTGQGYITPFRGKAQFIPGYRGYITLADNAGYTLEGHAVRQNDYFKYSFGLNPNLEHTPAVGGPSDRGEILYVYAVARSLTKPPVFKVVHIEKVLEIRNKSEAYKAFMSGKIKSTPWDSDFEPMAVKTAIRALAPQLPLNVQKAAAIEGAHERGELINLDEQGNISTTPDAPEPEPKTQPSAEDLGLDFICNDCGGRGVIEDAQGNKSPCEGC